MTDIHSDADARRWFESTRSGTLQRRTTGIESTEKPAYAENAHSGIQSAQHATFQAAVPFANRLATKLQTKRKILQNGQNGGATDLKVQRSASIISADSIARSFMIGEGIMLAGRHVDALVSFRY